MRVSAKIFLVDPDGRLLLLSCTDPARPHLRWLELPGGGVEPGEDAVTATVREVREETGVVLDPALVGPLQWTQRAGFRWRGEDHVADHEGRLARLDGTPETVAQELTEGEVGTVLDLRWWTPEELAAYEGMTFPRSLVALLPRLLAGERVDEPYDDWESGWEPA